MFIDYITLMLINMVGALVTLSLFLWKGIDQEEKKNWASAFMIPGLVGVICGFAMTFTSPVPKPYSMAYGEMSVLLGVLFVGTAWSLAKDWDLLPLGIYAFFAGGAAVLLGLRIIDLSLTKAPVLSGLGFILTGFGGVFAGLTIWQCKVKILRVIGILTLLAASAIWALTGYLAYWSHMFVE